MTNIPQCYLTMKDFGVLEQLLEGDISDLAYLRLLRSKIAGATIVFEDDLPPDVAVIGSRIEFQIDGLLVDCCLLSADASAVRSRLKLSITTMRGLALLGLRERAFIVVERPDGGGEQLRLLKVHRAAPRVADVIRLPRVQTSGATFAMARKPALDDDPDDDPDPQAA